MNWFLFLQRDLHVRILSCELQVSLCLLLLILQSMAAGVGTSNFFRVFLRGVLQLSICRIIKNNYSQPTCIVELWFLDCPLLFFFSLRCIWQVFPYLWPQVIGPGCCLLLCQPFPGPWKSVWTFFSFSIVNRVKPVHASDGSRFPSTFRQ